MNTKPNVCILRTDGTNCDEELFYAFELAGAKSHMVHVNELRNKDKSLRDFQVLALPGGFTYGDDIASGKVLAVELMSFFKNELQTFINQKGFVLGVCNGFQTLVRTGLLPFSNLGKMDVTLTHNDSGHFECRWIRIKAEKNPCVFLNDLRDPIDIAVNHGEGKLFCDEATLKKLEDEELVVFRYIDPEGFATQKYPYNPNGALNAIAGICDKTGRILGLMPHPEKFVLHEQHPNWRRKKFTKPHGLLFYEKLVQFVKIS